MKSVAVNAALLKIKVKNFDNKIIFLPLSLGLTSKITLDSYSSSNFGLGGIFEKKFWRSQNPLTGLGGSVTGLGGYLWREVPP